MVKQGHFEVLRKKSSNMPRVVGLRNPKMASDLKLDLVMTSSKQRPNVQYLLLLKGILIFHASQICILVLLKFIPTSCCLHHSICGIVLVYISNCLLNTPYYGIFVCTSQWPSGLGLAVTYVCDGHIKASTNNTNARSPGKGNHYS